MKQKGGMATAITDGSSSSSSRRRRRRRRRREEINRCAALLHPCPKKQDFRKAYGPHAHIMLGRMPGSHILRKKNPYMATAMITMYIKRGMLAEAREVLEELPTRCVAVWNALIAGYADQRQVLEAFSCFERMQGEALTPDAITFMCILQACGSTGAVHKGQEIHEEIANMGFLAKHIMLGTALVDMYVKCGLLAKAKQVLEELPFRNVVTWNVIITGYAQQDQGHAALNCFEQMQNEGLSPNAVTFTCFSKACGGIGAIDKCWGIHHNLVIKGLMKKDGILGNALVHMYMKCGMLCEAKDIVNKLQIWDIVVWNSLTVVS